MGAPPTYIPPQSSCAERRCGRAVEGPVEAPERRVRHGAIAVFRSLRASRPKRDGFLRLRFAHLSDYRPLKPVGMWVGCSLADPRNCLRTSFRVLRESLLWAPGP